MQNTTELPNHTPRSLQNHRYCAQIVAAPLTNGGGTNIVSLYVYMQWWSAGNAK